MPNLQGGQVWAIKMTSPNKMAD